MQMKYSLAMSVVAVTVVSAMFRADAASSFTLRQELSGMVFDWSDGGSYTNNAAPSAVGAYVEIPEGMDALLCASNTASWTFVNTYVSRIRPLESTSRLVVDVDGDTATATLASEVCWNDSNEQSTRNKGGIVKTGEGELVLFQGRLLALVVVHVAGNDKERPAVERTVVAGELGLRRGLGREYEFLPRSLRAGLRHEGKQGADDEKDFSNHSAGTPGNPIQILKRRRRDSNPRDVAAQQFSRLPPSTTRPHLRLLGVQR